MMNDRKREKHADIEEIIREWLYIIFSDSYSYLDASISFEVCGRDLYIYSNIPGILIGKYGCNVEKLREMLPKTIKHIDFVELGKGLHPRELCVKRRFFGLLR